MPVAVTYKKPVIYDEDFLQPAVAKPVNTTPTITSTTTAPVNAGVSAIVEPNIVNPIATKTCEEQASAKMATMRFSSAQGASDYRNNFINQCKGLPTESSSVVKTTIQPTTQTPINVGVSNVSQPDFSNVKVYDLDTPTETPVKAGVSNVVEPDFSKVKVYDLDTPSGSPSVNTTENTSGSSDVPNENTGSSNATSGSNGETKSSATIISKKPNYALYGGIAISAIILYKLLK